jgi:hypothetical protein
VRGVALPDQPGEVRAGEACREEVLPLDGELPRVHPEVTGGVLSIPQEGEGHENPRSADRILKEKGRQAMGLHGVYSFRVRALPRNQLSDRR